MCQFINFLTDVPLREQAEGELTTAEWKSVIDQVRPSSLVTFTGGEPWLRRDFLELAEHACRKCIVHCITNGTLLREPMIDRIVELAPKRIGLKGWFFIGISLDGLGDVHDEIRAQKGAFERSTKAIRSIVERRREAGKRFPLLHSTAVVQEANLDILPEMPKHLSELGVDVFNLTLEYRGLDELGHVEPIDYNFEDLRLPVIERDRLERALNATRDAAAAAGIELRMPRMPMEEILRYYGGGITLNRFQCRVAWNTVTIDYKGDLSPCYLQTMGNVREQSIKDLWRGDKMTSFRTGCKESLWPACQGCCENEYRGGSTEQVRFPLADGQRPSAPSTSEPGSLDGSAAARASLRIVTE
jgi:radical SAM protein with 4Fe4S-binding SPASM domain